MRTSARMASLLLVWLAASAASGQSPLSGLPPRPQELEPGDAASAPPPGPLFPPSSSRYVPIPDMQSAPADNLPAPAYTPPVPTSGASSAASAPAATPAATSGAMGLDQPDISPNNPEKWRYVYRNGGWWYYTPTRQWMYWSAGRWVEYARPAVSNTSVYVQPPVVSRPRANLRIGVGRAYYPYGPYGYAPYGSGPYGSGPYPYGGVGVGVGVY